MAIVWGFMRPASMPNAGDIFIVRATRNQSRWNGTAWEEITPAKETRGDVMPSDGTTDQVLVRTAFNDAFAVKWDEPGPGLIWEADFTNVDTWVCTHNLRNKFVSILAVKDDGTVMIPDIDYENADDSFVSLRFEEAVSGTAIIRR
jgi:hypothetical protein